MFKSIRRAFVSAIAWLLAVELPTRNVVRERVEYTQDLEKSFKPFFVHKHRGPGKLADPGKYRGFTAYVTPNLENHRMCNVQITYCSNRDAFCKREGRSFAREAEIHVINKRDLPGVLGEANTMLWSKDPLPGTGFVHDYNWILKYVI